ncbi:MAG: hypothetical protein RL385_47 [Pseudomonadota bacterium]|jgi:hypothetical protein
MQQDLMVAPDDIGPRLAASLADFDISLLGQQLSEHGAVELPRFLAPLHRSGEKVADAVLAAHGRSLDARVASTGHTPRRYRSVGRDDVFAHASLLAQIYLHPALLGFLSSLTRGEVSVLPYLPEQIVVNQMSGVGETHGWHWDDYSYSLVWVLRAPRPESGGHVEYIDRTSWDKQAPQVEHYLQTRPVKKLQVASGSAYLLLGKRAMHRVAPLVQPDTRKIVCFSYAHADERFAEIDHGSMTDLYG